MCFVRYYLQHRYMYNTINQSTMATKRKTKTKDDCSQTVNRNKSADHETLDRAKEMERQRQAENGLQTVRIDAQTIIVVEVGVSPEEVRKSFISKLNECRKKYY